MPPSQAIAPEAVRAAPIAAAAAPSLRAWVDIENPPQVQYLVPLVEGLRQRGLDVLITARDYGDTFDLLDRRGVTYVPVGRHFGAAKLAKVTGSLRRALRLRRFARGSLRPDFLVSASRSAALAARTFGLPSFALCDYEYVDLSVFRATRSYVVHPGVIGVESFTRRGVREELLLPYEGIKEDITFADIDVEAIPPHRFPELEDTGAFKVLVRPPAEESHYHSAASSESLRRVLAWLSSRDDVVVIYSPRYPWQTTQLDAFDWRRRPIVLDEPVEFVRLYKGVDVVFSGGGTMIREAAYLGIPAVTTFRGALGDVDCHLQSLGRVTVAAGPDELERLDLRGLRRLPPLRINPRARDDVLEAILAVVAARTRTARATRGQ
jgi:predicted glycosyltransferase